MNPGRGLCNGPSSLALQEGDRRKTVFVAYTYRAELIVFRTTCCTFVRRRARVYWLLSGDHHTDWPKS